MQIQRAYYYWKKFEFRNGSEQPITNKGRQRERERRKIKSLGKIVLSVGGWGEREGKTKGKILWRNIEHRARTIYYKEL